MDPIYIGLGAIAALAALAFLLTVRNLTARELELKALKEHLETSRKEREDARMEAREAARTADEKISELRELRKNLKSAKKKAYKAETKVKSSTTQKAHRDDWSSAKESELRNLRNGMEAAQVELDPLKARIRALESELSHAEGADRPESAAVAVGADPARVRELEGQLERLQDKLDRLQGSLDGERSSSRDRDRDRDRDLITARKLAVQHERSFQVVRGQLDLAREQLTALGESLGAPEFPAGAGADGAASDGGDAVDAPSEEEAAPAPAS